jgi:hypothetical protein
VANLWTAWFIRAFKGKECCVNWHAAATSFATRTKIAVMFGAPNRAAYAGNVGALNCCHACNVLDLVRPLAPMSYRETRWVEQEDRSATAPVRTCWSALPNSKSSILCEEPAPLKRSW